MASGYLASGNIKIYPSAFRSHSIDPESYLSTEFNIVHTKILSESKDLNSWVLEDFTDTTNGYLIIYLGGYYFRCKKSDILAISGLSSADNIWAHIGLISQTAQTTSSSVTYQNKRLSNLNSSSTDSLDVNSVFQGIQFTDSTISSTDVNVFEIKVLEKSGSNYVIPSTSKLKLLTSEVKDSSGNPISTYFTTNTLNTQNITMPSGSSLDATAKNVGHSLTLKLNGGTTEGTNMFTYDGSDEKLANITASGVGAAASSHTHGNITNAGALQTSDVTVASGDKLVITDSSNSNKVARSSTSFDGSTTTKFLAPKGSFESISAGALATYSSSSTQKMLTVTNGTMTWTDTPEGVSVGDGIIYVDSNNVFSANTSRNLNFRSGSNISLIYYSGDNEVVITATDTTYSTATSSTLGLVKIGYTQSGKNYPVALSNGQMYVNVPWTDTQLGVATSSALGGIKIGYSSSGKNYAVQLDSSNKAYVNVPWSNTTYSAGTNLSISGTTLAVVSSPTFSGTVTAASFNATSDKRLKENIVDYKCEKSILDLPIKKFDFIEGPKNQIGCIAQDLQEICPEIVHEGEDGYLSIQESKLVYLLIDEVKKLKEEVEELKRGN